MIKSDFFINLEKEGNCSVSMREILHLINDNRFEPLTVQSIVERNNITSEVLKKEAIDVFMDYAKYILLDNHIDDNEMLLAKKYKLLFRIKEGDFLSFGKSNEIKEIITAESKRFYSDSQIDEHESLAKVSLQELFDLGYDQYLDFEKEVVEDALAQGANLHKLDTFYNI